MEFQKGSIKVSVLLILLLVLGYLQTRYIDYLPPKTTIKSARLASRLDLPYSSRIIKYEEFNTCTYNEGYLYYDIKIEEKYFEKVLLDATNKGYKKITKYNLHKDRVIEPWNDKSIESIRNGLYIYDSICINDNILSYKISAIDIDSMAVIIFVSLY